MAKQLNADLDILVNEKGFSYLQEDMVRVFQSAFTALSENSSATLGGEAERAASELRALIPPEKIAELAKEPEGEFDILELFEEVWRGLIYVATRIPHQDDKSHTLITKALQALRAGPDPHWKDLCDELGPMIRDMWSSSDGYIEYHRPEEDNGYMLSQWLNLNSFVAHLFGSGVFPTDPFPIWQLQQGLEGDLAEEPKGDCPPAETVDNRVAVASEWLIHAGPALLRASLLDLGESGWIYRAGVLFQGSQGFNLERWGFWKRRLGELRSTVSEEVALAVDRAIESMKTSAAALAGTEGNG